MTYQQPQDQPQYQQSQYQQGQFQQPQYQQNYGYAPAVQVAAPHPSMAPPAAGPPWGAPPKRRVAFEIIVVVLGALLAAAFIVLMAFASDAGAVALAIAASIVPLLIVGSVLLWVDRWEPEPRLLLVAAFLWGGGVAVAVASLLNSVVGPAVAKAIGSGLDSDLASAVFGAPLVEEGMKGLGILLIFLLRRRDFNGPVDGVVYGGVVALGFAIVEDIQYFALTGGDNLGPILVMRGLLSPFGHLIYSVCMGLALGIASRQRSRAAWVWLYPIGYLCAVGMHMAWNGSLTQVDSLGGVAAIFLFLNWVPLALFTVLVFWLRRRESKLVAARLQEYVPAGWLNAGEVHTLSSMRGRIQASQWAARFGARASMKAYQRAATALAYARQDLYTGHEGIRTRNDEMTNLQRLAASRAEFMARSAPTAGYAVGGHA